MHADGGVISGITTLTSWQVDITEKTSQRRDQFAAPTFYIVRNGKITSEAQTVDHSLVDIAGRSIFTLLKSQGIGDLLSAYAAARIRGGDYYATWIGDDFVHDRPGPFDPGYMRALSNYGYNLMKSGNAWARKPPVLMNASERAAAFRAEGLQASGQAEAATQ